MSIFQQSPTERWQVVEAPAALPGCCFLCRADSSNRDWFVDLGLQFEFHGAVYVCNECLNELARTVGWITPDQAAKLNADLAALKRENYQLLLENSSYHKMEEAINEFNRSRSSHPGGDIRHPALSGPHLVLHQGEGSSDEPDRLPSDGSSGGADGVGTGEGTAPEPGDDSGMDELRPDAGGNAEFKLDI